MTMAIINGKGVGPITRREARIKAHQQQEFYKLYSESATFKSGYVVGLAYGSIVFHAHIFFAFPSNIKFLSTRNNSFEEVLGLHSNTICQICFAPTNYSCWLPNRCHPQQLHSIPGYATFTSIYVSE